MVPCNMLSGMALFHIFNRKIRLLSPVSDQISSIIFRTIIDDQPLKIMERLRL